MQSETTETNEVATRETDADADRLNALRRSAGGDDASLFRAVFHLYFRADPRDGAASARQIRALVELLGDPELRRRARRYAAVLEARRGAA